MTVRRVTAFLLAASLAACGVDDLDDEDPRVDDPTLADRDATVHGVVEGSPDAIGLLRVANELSQTALHSDAGVTKTASKGIVAKRPLATLKQLDAVYYVGAQTFGHLVDYARAHGYVPGSGADAGVPGGPAIKTIFVIVMENTNWSSIVGSSSAPYLNSLIPKAARAEAYYNPPSLHPSEPNYLWLEGGQDFGIDDDADPISNHVTSHEHLAYLLDGAGVSWRSYQEDISGTGCPLKATGKYAPKHNPFVFFDDETGGTSTTDARCQAHNRPYGELAGDLAAGRVARYNFITPNLCHDMHDICLPTLNRIRQGDDWLAAEVPRLLASQAYHDGGVLFITWDEAARGDGPIGMLVLSPLAKGGYGNTIRYSHSSTLRTLEEIFGVSPMLGDAQSASDLSDLFREFP